MRTFAVCIFKYKEITLYAVFWIRMDPHQSDKLDRIRIN